jgi:hypothetical protein
VRVFGDHRRLIGIPWQLGTATPARQTAPPMRPWMVGNSERKVREMTIVIAGTR